MAEMWYALHTSRDVLANFNVWATTAEEFFSPFSQVDSEANNVASSGRMSNNADSMCNQLMRGRAPHNVLPHISSTDSIESIGEFDPTYDTITHAIQLLGGSRSSSTTTQMASGWGDEDDTIQVAHTRAAAVAVASAGSAAPVCPPTPVRAPPPVRLVPASELGMYITSA